MRELSFIETIGTPKKYPQIDKIMTGFLVSEQTFTLVPDAVTYQINFLPISRKKQTFLRKKILSLSAFVIIGISLLVAAFLFTPSLYYKVFPAEPVPVVATSEGTIFGGDFEKGADEAIVEEAYQPPYNENLPEGSWLVIPKIGVRTELKKTETPEEALTQGVWQVPDFGVPGDTTQPMILAAHRFGYKKWWNGTDYWKYHSFYLLPDTEPGDRIEVIYDHRKWVYEIYAGELNQEITDYNADLILYTCKYLVGDDRHIRYARLIDPTADTQELSSL